jgi:phosphoenolpyruvate carboxykinase (GTP)
MNEKITSWLGEMRELLAPTDVIWIDGSDEQLAEIREESENNGEIIRLNSEKYPNCYLHRTAENDVARVEDRTFICCENQSDAGPTNNWVAPAEMYEKLRGLYKNCMNGKPLYVIPFLMGPPDSRFSKIGIQLTDSRYVVLNMAIMTQVGKVATDALGANGDFVKCLHATADLDPENRYICHFPQDNTVWSINSAYGGNVLLSKKCLALRLASDMGRREGWLAEHMLILGLESPSGDVHYVAAAFPSACGKTNLAMLIPPVQFPGYKVWTVGDDIAWIRVGADGRLWAVNPEAGFFGVAPLTSKKTNPNALASIQKNTIFTNVALNMDDNTPWWEGADTPEPENVVDWRGNVWQNGEHKNSDTPLAHPNSRFTAPISGCPCRSTEWANPEGVPLSAIIFGGRRAKTAPLVYEAFDWNHGVYVGATMASETTAAASGAVGVVRRDPMAMLPFCGYNMGDYFVHWLNMGEKASQPPKIFHVNWFKKGDDGKFLWRGFGENLRVLLWILDRCTNKIGARKSAIGFLPNKEDINLDGLDITETAINELLSADVQSWREDIAAQRKFFEPFGEKLPREIAEQLNETEKMLINSTENVGVGFSGEYS